MQTKKAVIAGNQISSASGQCRAEHAIVFFIRSDACHELRFDDDRGLPKKVNRRSCSILIESLLEVRLAPSLLHALDNVFREDELKNRFKPHLNQGAGDALERWKAGNNDVDVEDYSPHEFVATCSRAR